jgi:hypothetical protein
VRGRIRTVKPEVFSDEQLWDLELETGLPLLRVFIGLWCYCDREGRFIWSPRSLRGAIAPCWDGDMAAALEALASKLYVVRYTVNGKDYGYVRTFKEHQVINAKETPSVLPPPVAHATSTGEPRDEHAMPEPEVTGHFLSRGEGKGREGEGNGRGEGKSRGSRVTARERSGATALHRDEPDLTEPVSHVRIPQGWTVTDAFYGEALAAGVTAEILDEDVAYWRGRKLGGEWFDIEQFFRAHFPRLAKRRETESFKRSRSAPDERLQEQADRVKMLREQEAQEDQLARAGVNS